MRLTIHALILLVLTAWLGQVHGQTYQCKRNNGTTYLTNKPCPPPGLVYYGPSETGTSSRSDTSYTRAQPAGQELKYLSPECSRLSEGIRTAAVRGVKYDAVQSSQKEFYEKCSEELSEARQKLNSEKNEKKMLEQEGKKTTQLQAALSKEDEARKFRQCAEMRGALANRKAKANPTDGEKNDITVFEQRYRDRCS
jgi:hypothetical protein